MGRGEIFQLFWIHIAGVDAREQFVGLRLEGQQVLGIPGNRGIDGEEAHQTRLRLLYQPFQTERLTGADGFDQLGGGGLFPWHLLLRKHGPGAAVQGVILSPEF